MTLQPYFPEPITVSHNVAEAKQRTRVRFVRWVVAGHFVSTSLVAVLAAWVQPPMSMVSAVLALFGCLVALTVQRRAARGGAEDNVLSVVLLLPTLFTLSLVVRLLYDGGWPVLVLLPAIVGTALYALCCGNDFSYTGQFVLCALATGATSIVFVATGVYTAGEAWLGFLLALAYLFYFVYDLSMLVKRRRLGEAPAAVADLYRDLLNFATYSVRVYLHWRRFRFI